ncbi:unnamed protein product [Lota lota]
MMRPNGLTSSGTRGAPRTHRPAQEMFPLPPSVLMGRTYWKSKQKQEEGTGVMSQDSGLAPLFSQDIRD